MTVAQAWRAFVFGTTLLIAAMTTPTQALTNCTVSDLTIDSQESQFVVLLNQYRAQSGLSAVSVAPSLNRAATWVAQDQTTHAYFSHTDSLGRDPFTRMHDCGYPQAGGENLAYGNLPGHNAAMLQPGFTQIGIARVGIYWALDFGFGDEEYTPTPVIWRVHLGPIMREP